MPGTSQQVHVRFRQVSLHDWFLGEILAPIACAVLNFSGITNPTIPYQCGMQSFQRLRRGRCSFQMCRTAAKFKELMSSAVAGEQALAVWSGCSGKQGWALRVAGPRAFPSWSLRREASESRSRPQGARTGSWGWRDGSRGSSPERRGCCQVSEAGCLGE